MLLDHGANVNAENERGETSLHLVSRSNYDSQKDGVRIARLLLEQGVDVNGRKGKKWTPLHSAALKGKLEIARALLDHSANPNAENEQGETPLHVVSQGEYYDCKEYGVRIARLLLERGANVNAPDKDQYTPLYSASYFERLEIAQVLRNHGAKEARPATRSTRGTKRKADDIGNRSEKKPKLHEDMHSPPWRQCGTPHQPRCLMGGYATLYLRGGGDLQ